MSKMNYRAWNHRRWLVSYMSREQVGFFFSFFSLSRLTSLSQYTSLFDAFA